MNATSEKYIHYFLNSGTSLKLKTALLHGGFFYFFKYFYV